MQVGKIDFDMEDALSDCIRVGIVEEDVTAGTVCAVPLPQAVKLMSITRYPEDRAENPTSSVLKQKKLKWTEIITEGGSQPVRMFQNKLTGQLTDEVTFCSSVSSCKLPRTWCSLDPQR